MSHTWNSEHCCEDGIETAYDRLQGDVASLIRNAIDDVIPSEMDADCDDLKRIGTSVAEHVKENLAFAMESIVSDVDDHITSLKDRWEKDRYDCYTWEDMNEKDEEIDELTKTVQELEDKDGEITVDGEQFRFIPESGVFCSHSGRILTLEDAGDMMVNCGNVWY